MQFVSLIFFCLLILVISALSLENKVIKKISNLTVTQKVTLLLASYLFIAYANIWFAVILLLQTIITWYSARKKNYRIGVCTMVIFLGFFKYTNFFYSSFAELFGANDIVFLKIILPLGISFYTFSAISYLIDVKCGKQIARSMTDVALYLAFFPKFTSGPIQRSNDFFSQADKQRNITWKVIGDGLQIFAFGIFKKFVLADHLAIFVNQVYSTPVAFSSGTVLLAVISYSLQIYFDFSGYSDMAIGIARMIDIQLPQNFNLPYFAHNVTELWKRWHITLSSWLQDYLYIPLGGSRKGKLRTYINLILTMVIGGIWHGANWTFIIWGLLHGIGLTVHKLWMKITNSSTKFHSNLSNIFSIVITFSYTSFCWIFFRADSIQDAFIIIRQLFSFANGICHPFIWSFIALSILLISSIFAAFKSKEHKNHLKKKNQSYVNGYYPTVNLDSFWGLVGFFVFLGLTFILAYTGGNPFIYGAY